MIDQSIAMPAATTKSINRFFLEKLKQTIDERGISDRALAASAGVAANTIGNYKRYAEQFTSKGKEKSAGLVEVEKIARALRLSPVEMLFEDPPELQVELDEMTQRLVDGFSELLSDGKADVLRLVEQKVAQVRELKRRMLVEQFGVADLERRRPGPASPPIAGGRRKDDTG